MDPTRREFLGLAGSTGATALLGSLLLPDPAAAAAPADHKEPRPHWVEKADGALVYRFELAESWCFPAGLREQGLWSIRCGGTWRTEAFQGTQEQAMRETERFTVMAVRELLAALERVAFRVERS